MRLESDFRGSYTWVQICHLILSFNSKYLPWGKVFTSRNQVLAVRFIGHALGRLAPKSACFLIHKLLLLKILLWTFPISWFYKSQFSRQKNLDISTTKLRSEQERNVGTFLSMRGIFIAAFGRLELLSPPPRNKRSTWHVVLILSNAVRGPQSIPIKEIIYFAAITYEDASQHKIMGAE